jgi:hypothetical protein
VGQRNRREHKRSDLVGREPARDGRRTPGGARLRHRLPVRPGSRKRWASRTDAQPVPLADRTTSLETDPGDPPCGPGGDGSRSPREVRRPTSSRGDREGATRCRSRDREGRGARGALRRIRCMRRRAQARPAASQGDEPARDDARPDLPLVMSGHRAEIDRCRLPEQPSRITVLMCYRRCRIAPGPMSLWATYARNGVAVDNLTRPKFPPR